MKIEITDSPESTDSDFIAKQTRAFNSTFVPDDYSPLCVFYRDDNDKLCGGLTAKTYWSYLDITFLWVRDHLRNEGLGTTMLKEAEREAINRGCRYALLDTYSFQALPFYKKNGFQTFGKIDGFCDEHSRYFLRKKLS